MSRVEYTIRSLAASCGSTGLLHSTHRKCRASALSRFLNARANSISIAQSADLTIRSDYTPRLIHQKGATGLGACSQVHSRKPRKTSAFRPPFSVAFIVDGYEELF